MLAAQGATTREAADALLWDFQRVQQWEQKLGIRLRRVQPRRDLSQENAQLRELARAGMTLKEAALASGLSYLTVCNRERSLGLNFKRSRNRSAHQNVAQTA
jgi:hypothetical protein